MSKLLRNKKRKIAVVLLLSMILANLQPLAIAAKESSTNDVNTATYYDTTSNCEIKLVHIEPEVKSQNEMSETRTGYYEVYENDILSYSMVIDVDEDMIECYYADGKIQKEKLSNYIVFTEEICEEIPVNESNIGVSENSNMFTTRAIDVVDTAKEEVNEYTGIQTKLNTTVYADNFEAMGYRGGYWYAPTVYGYLQRKISAYSVSYQLKFDVTKGTQASVVAATLYERLKNTSWKDVLLSAITNAIFAVFGITIDSNATGEYQIRTYRWDYRVRLNSNTGSIIGTDYRTKTYTRVFNPASGKVNYQYNGNKYDDGFPLSNSEMIKAKIDEYLER